MNAAEAQKKEAEDENKESPTLYPSHSRLEPDGCCGVDSLPVGFCVKPGISWAFKLNNPPEEGDGKVPNSMVRSHGIVKVRGRIVSLLLHPDVQAFNPDTQRKADLRGRTEFKGWDSLTGDRGIHRP